MTWTVRFHPAVLQDDFRRLPKPVLKEILSAIRTRLTLDPERYGEPLRKELFGYWKLRVGDYRVIYRMRKRELLVLVVKVGPRKDRRIYREMVRRAKRFLT